MAVDLREEERENDWVDCEATTRQTAATTTTTRRELTDDVQERCLFVRFTRWWLAGTDADTRRGMGEGEREAVLSKGVVLVPSHQGTLCDPRVHSIPPVNSDAQKCIPNCFPCRITDRDRDSTRYTRYHSSFPASYSLPQRVRTQANSTYKLHSIPSPSSPIPSTCHKNPSPSPASGDPRNSHEPLSAASLRFSDIHARPRCTGSSVHTRSIVGRSSGSRRIRPRISVISAALQC